MGRKELNVGQVQGVVLERWHLCLEMIGAEKAPDV